MEPDPFAIRTCTEADLPTLEDFCRRLYLEQAYDRPPESIAGRLSPYSLVAEVAGEPVGFILAVCETIEFMKSELGRDPFRGRSTTLRSRSCTCCLDFGAGE